MKRLNALLLACFMSGQALLGTAQNAEAQTGFGEAVELWLQGNDRDSLPALADLARNGDRNARILLARIETFDRGPSPYRFALSGAERRALFRRVEPTEIFGTSWLKVEANNGNILAENFLKSRHPEPDLKLIQELWDAGERQATDYPTRVVALYGTDEHPNVATSLHELAGVLKAQGDLNGARSRLERSLQIKEALHLRLHGLRGICEEHPERHAQHLFVAGE